MSYVVSMKYGPNVAGIFLIVPKECIVQKALVIWIVQTAKINAVATLCQLKGWTF